ncbi:Cu(I)-responsive transcriptional regulator [Vibrio sp. ZSDZ34]|uniref:HTH-type transcriptional regulator CueR n=1 Tax=Vibrio gelatinilyticus TaxID=2893468 RepID=A0A9X1WEV6_9VIBR|nr:Cu(I)-responsive transcriptional regulator [Vibrio gelatinilyticus]MCJ2375719.1 Cu(I)-responsive transcriptional regulator [Vibrio gelatinilyticus]
MNISQVAKLTGLTSKSIRLYEERDVISAPTRSDNGYRVYSNKQVDELKFVSNARKAGFSLDECKELLAMERNPHRMSAQVKHFASNKLSDIREQIEALRNIECKLQEWVERCPGDGQSACPIIDGLKEGN